MSHESQGAVPSTMEWQSQRNELSHDWLKNTFMPALAKLSNMLEGRVRDDQWINTFIGEILPGWSSRRSDFDTLISTFELAMSPRPFVAASQFGNRAWLGELVHCLWSTRLGSPVLVSNAKATMRATDDAYRKLVCAVPTQERWSLADLHGCIEPLLMFRKCCQELGDAISSFPREVMFT